VGGRKGEGSRRAAWWGLEKGEERGDVQAEMGVADFWAGVGKGGKWKTGGGGVVEREKKGRPLREQSATSSNPDKKKKKSTRCVVGKHKKKKRGGLE